MSDAPASDEKPCYGDICTPSASEATRGDLLAAVQTLAADNARMCNILIAVDAFVLAVEDVLVFNRSKKLTRALEAYKVVRNGQ